MGLRLALATRTPQGSDARGSEYNLFPTAFQHCHEEGLQRALEALVGFRPRTLVPECTAALCVYTTFVYMFMSYILSVCLRVYIPVFVSGCVSVCCGLSSMVDTPPGSLQCYTR